MSRKQSKSNAQNGKNKGKKSNLVIYILAFLILLAGVAIFSYPAVSNYLQEINHANAISVYDEAIKQKSHDELEAELKKAEEYNNTLMGDPVRDPFMPGSGYTLPKNYMSVLNIENNGMMGYIEIPKISVNLPIYHTTSEAVLQKGVGHIESTPLPIGGKGKHSVLTGHTGLPSAELFTRLSELGVGDKFYIKVLGQTLAYKVIEINVVLPDELENLVSEKDRDLVTLVTCTPYGVNSHRLLVKGERCAYNYNDENNDGKSSSLFGGRYHYYIVGIVIALSIVLVAVIIIVIITKIRKRIRKNEQKKKE